MPVNPNAPTVDAGVDMVTWSGEEVQLAPTVTNNDPLEPSLTYSWTAEPDDGVVFSATDIEAPTVTITKATANPSPIKLKLAVTLEDVDTVSDFMTIDVYDDSCKASTGNGYEYGVTDFDGDCITRLGDLAVMAKAWLVDYSLTGPAEKP